MFWSRVKYVCWSWMIISALALLFSCTNDRKTDVVKDKHNTTSKNKIAKIGKSNPPIKKERVPVVHTVVDSMVMAEIGQSQSSRRTIFESYNRDLDSYQNWSEKLWGRCCTSADIQYSEFIFFDITTNYQLKDYPLSNALSPNYLDPYVFKIDQEISLDIRLDLESDWFTYEGMSDVSPKKAIEARDTILFPFQMTLVNGMVKSKNDYNANARIKKMELWYNGEHINDVLLPDSPEPQIIILDIPFFKYDKIQLKPIEFYPGSKYDDVCISAFQRSILHSVYVPFNRKFTRKYYGL